MYRLVRSIYKNDISGNGAYLYGGRWNSKGQYALYASEHISLAALEIVVNYDSSLYTILPEYSLLILEVPDTPVVHIKESGLKENWVRDFEYSQFIGDQFLQQRLRLVLKIPSAVITEEYNLMLNPLHTDFKKIRIQISKPYRLDNRLFGKA